ncbi:MAG: LysR family transcriptional regulator [Traorella sp.]
MFDKKIIYFISVVQEGSFSAAARKLYLSQSAISQYIAILEDELKTQLFDRSHYRPLLTEAGQFYYQNCLDLMNQYEQIVEQMNMKYNQNIKIGFTGSYENKDILSMIHLFKENQKNVNVSFIEGNFEECIQNLAQGKVDVAFGLESDFKRRSDIEYQKLHAYELCVICSFHHRFANQSQIDIHEIKNEDLIVLSPSFGKGFYKDFMNAFKLDQIKPKIKKSVDSFDELVFNVSIGEGIAIASKDVVRESEVRAIPIINSHHQSNYVIGYQKERNDLISSFVNHCVEHFQTL